MSTSYYRLAVPFTHLRVEEQGGAHVRLTLWVNHANAGALTLRTEELSDVLNAVFKYEEDNECPLRTHWGGADRGAVVTVNDPALPDEAIVRSEYGHLLTVAEVKARDGAKRADGYPTELFGYEASP